MIDPRSGDGSTTLEVRWLRRGRLRDDVIAWAGPFGDEIEERQDRYLVAASGNVGVKIRGGTQLDLKAFRGSQGELTIPAVARGNLEVWERWSFPLDIGNLPRADDPAWLTIGKSRRRRSFGVAGARVTERPVSEAGAPGCTLELTEVNVDRETWWTLGLEARGDPQTLERVVRLTAESLLRVPVPDGFELDLTDSVSYAEWLGRRAERLAGGGTGAS